MQAFYAGTLCRYFMQLLYATASVCSRIGVQPKIEPLINAVLNFNKMLFVILFVIEGYTQTNHFKFKSHGNAKG